MDGLEQELLAFTESGRSVGNEWSEVGPDRKPIVSQKVIERESPISLLFGGSMRSVVKSVGSKDSVTIQPFQSLQLDITVRNPIVIISHRMLIVLSMRFII